MADKTTDQGCCIVKNGIFTGTLYKRGGAAAAVFYEMPKYSMNLDFSILIEYGSGFFLCIIDKKIVKDL